MDCRYLWPTGLGARSPFDLKLSGESPPALLLSMLLAAAALSAPCLAAELAQPAGLVREAVVIPFTQSDGTAITLEAVVVRPAAPSRYPLALINHGGPRTAEVRENIVALYSATAIEFARRGWAVGVVARRGHGVSQGSFAEG